MADWYQSELLGEIRTCLFISALFNINYHIISYGLESLILYRLLLFLIVSGHLSGFICFKIRNYVCLCIPSSYPILSLKKKVKKPGFSFWDCIRLILNTSDFFKI